jgi:hypothetical protein
VSLGNDFMVLLRPDNHIALISSEVTPALVRDYLKRIAERERPDRPSQMVRVLD